MPRSTVSLQKARAVKKKAARVFRQPCVVGVGITKVGEDYGIKVNVRSPEDVDAFPPEIEGVPIRIEVTGSIHPQ